MQSRLLVYFSVSQSIASSLPKYHISIFKNNSKEKKIEKRRRKENVYGKDNM